jgi:hypothetical protein
VLALGLVAAGALPILLAVHYFYASHQVARVRAIGDPLVRAILQGQAELEMCMKAVSASGPDEWGGCVVSCPWLADHAAERMTALGHSPGGDPLLADDVIRYLEAADRLEPWHRRIWRLDLSLALAGFHEPQYLEVVSLHRIEPPRAGAPYYHLEGAAAVVTFEEPRILCMAGFEAWASPDGHDVAEQTMAAARRAYLGP